MHHERTLPAGRQASSAPAAFLVMTLAFVLSLAAAPAHVESPPEHYYNPKENINPDPDYVPGDWPFPDPFEAKTIYETKKRELLEIYSLEDKNHVFVIGGEIAFTALKNETAPVTGYFRNFSGAARLKEEGTPEKVEILIDLNSLDTGIPGRNNRILELFFNSAKAEFGTASLKFDVFEVLEDPGSLFVQDAYRLKAQGTITLNQATQPLEILLRVRQKGYTWRVQTEEKKPVELFLSDINFGNRIYELMKSCNHKALGNRVEINVELSFR